MKGHCRSLRIFSTAALACTLLTLPHMTVTASEEIGRAGRPGRYLLGDAAGGRERAGAICRHRPGGLIAAIEVKAPRVQAQRPLPRGDNGQRYESQFASWTPLLQKQTSTGWDTIKALEPSWDREVVPNGYSEFPSPVRRIGVTAPGTYRAAVRIEWYHPGDHPSPSTVTGQVTVAVTHHFAAGGTSKPFCHGAGSPVWWGPWFDPDGRPVRERTVASTPRRRLPVTGDFNGDGLSDIYWYSSRGVDKISWGADRTLRAVDSQQQAEADMTPAAGDFDGDGRHDIFWHGRGLAPDVIWWGAPDNSWEVRTGPQTPNAWEQVVSGDFDGDGFSDLFFYRSSDKTHRCSNAAPQVYWWGLDDRALLGSDTSSVTTFDCNFDFFTLDANGDGSDELVAYGQPPDIRDLIAWGEASTRPFSWTSSFKQPDGFRPVTGDFQDWDADAVFWFSPWGRDSQWWGGGGYEDEWFGGVSEGWVQFDGDFHPISDDFDGDGVDDILWYAP